MPGRPSLLARSARRRRLAARPVRAIPQAAPSAALAALLARLPDGIPLLAAGASAGLALALLGRKFFHVDEALYSSYGLLIASGRDPLLATQAVDKPPLFFYVQALAFLALGQSELAAKLPNLLAGLAAVLLVYRLSADLFDRPTAAAAVLLAALSPFTLIYSGTAFLDPFLAALALGALALAARGRAALTGLAAGAMLLAKPQGVLFLPLVVALLLVGPRPTGWRGLLVFCPGLVLAAGVALGWSSLRPQPFFVELATLHNPVRLLPPEHYWERLDAWWKVAVQHATESELMNLVLRYGVPVVVAGRLVAWLARRGDGRVRFDLLLGLFAAGFLGWHVATNSGIWDRYFTPVVPLLAILLARTLLAPWDAARALWPRLRVAGAEPAATLLAGLLAAGLMLRPAAQTLGGWVPLSTDGIGPNASYASFAAAADEVRAQAPPGAILYDYLWTSWHYGYFFPEDDYHFVWFDRQHVGSAVRNHDPATPRFLVLPTWLKKDGVLEWLRAEGAEPELLRVVPDWNGAPSLDVYRVVLPDRRPVESSTPRQR